MSHLLIGCWQHVGSDELNVLSRTCWVTAAEVCLTSHCYTLLYLCGRPQSGSRFSTTATSISWSPIVWVACCFAQYFVFFFRFSRSARSLIFVSLFPRSAASATNISQVARRHFKTFTSVFCQLLFSLWNLKFEFDKSWCRSATNLTSWHFLVKTNQPTTQKQKKSRRNKNFVMCIVKTWRFELPYTLVTTTQQYRQIS